MNVEFLEALEETAKEEGIERDDLYEAIKKGVKTAYQEHYDQKEEIEVEIDRKSGDIFIQTGDKRIPIDMGGFGRVAARKAEETIKQEIVKRKHQMIYEKYSKKVGELINGSVHRFEGRNVWLNLGQAEALLKSKERIPGERYNQGQSLRVYLYRVDNTNGDPKIFVSRTHPGFVKSLLKIEVPEITKGLIKIEKVAREPGVRSKIAVRSLSEDIEPVGTCVGARGSRVKEIVRELGGEKIDLIRWSEQTEELIKNSLEPASVVDMEMNEDRKEAIVLVPDDELSLAIGKGGQNVRLTAKLTGYKIDVTSREEIKRKDE